MTMETQSVPAADTTTPAIEDRGGYMPIANLWTAAADAMALHDAHHDNENRNAFDKAMDTLRKALVGITAARDQAAALYDSVTANVGRVGQQDGDVDVIGDWTHHNGEETHNGGGYWVDAWVWVEDKACRTCGEDYEDGGDGYDGNCPSCADKAEARGAERAARAAGWRKSEIADQFFHQEDGFSGCQASDGWMELCSEQNIAYNPADPDEEPED